MILDALLVVAAAFLIGAIPFGVIVGRVYGVDIRREGSGNIGAANALRTLGKGAGAAVLLLDALKGASAVLIATHVSPDSWLACGTAFAAVAGHCYSPLLRFRGGKGVATHLGAVCALAWPAGAFFVAAWLIAGLGSGYASVGSLSASAVAGLALWYFLGLPGLVYGLAASGLILYAHRENIARLRRGEENALGLLRPKRRA